MIRYKKYFLDFSDFESNDAKKKAFDIISNNFGVSFSSNAVLITKEKGKLAFSLINSSDSPFFESLNDIQSDDDDLYGYTGNDKAILPIKTFLIRTSKKITYEDCEFPRYTFKKSYRWPWEYPSVTACGYGGITPHITLNYKVSFMRSKPVPGSTGMTPDLKLVRISLDRDAGAGILLNNEFKKEYVTYPKGEHEILDGWVAEFRSSAVAQYYDFNIKARWFDNNAFILRTLPANNLNSNYTTTDVSRLEIGGTATLGFETPKKSVATYNQGYVTGEVSANVTYVQERRFTYNTSDYKVLRTPFSEQEIGFRWERDQYPTSQSVQGTFTSPAWGYYYPIDKKKVSEIGYKGFVPNYDVIFAAEPEQKEMTIFDLTATVGVRPFYNRIYRHFYLFTHHSYQGRDVAPKEISSKIGFKVDWNSAIFSGLFPVNIQIGRKNSECLSINNNNKNKVETDSCNSNSRAQSFIFENKSYKSVISPTMCLDANNIKTLTKCDDRMSQKWSWGEGFDNFTSELQSYIDGEVVALSYNDSNTLVTEPLKPGSINQKMTTNYTNLW
ncbi:leukocidin family pore-forming toxin [Photobacterium leiognathi subsp. mandapamensis]|uniref:leukocidin family pore-forming toxin n=1 Tax=Photobacterium leiognathi TaxID=553611 RepID=UPI003AF367DB